MNKLENEKHKTTSAGSDAFWVNTQLAGLSVIAKHSVCYRSGDLPQVVSPQQGGRKWFDILQSVVHESLQLHLLSSGILKGYFTVFKEAVPSEQS